MVQLRNDVLLVVAVALATAVEMVEALTIVLAVGVTRGWRSTMAGVGAAIGALAVLVVALGPSLARIPIADLRLVIGALLLIFGVQWLRKAILRSSGYKALHDEDEIFAKEQASARGASRAEGFDGYAFTVAFKGVFLEGLEVAFIVITFGAAQHRIGLAAAAAGASVLVVSLVGVLVHRPLSRVPENALKFMVGLLLTSFGIFWSAEGAGIKWPGSDAAVLALLAVLAAASGLLVAALGRQRRRNLQAEAA